jgi:hydroxymethylbilane synthase
MMLTMTETLRIGSRASELALWQAHWVRDHLAAAHPTLAVEIVIIKTKGDKVLDAPLSKIGDKGLFTREIEHALLHRDIDLAVHSLKDLPTTLPDGLELGAVTEREDVRDVFLHRPGSAIRTLVELPQGSAVATGSLRRKSQLLHMRPDLVIVDLRGNLNTRFAKLEASTWAGMVLARAGVVRLGWADRIGEAIDPLRILPAVGQGALGIEIRAADERVRILIAVLNHPPTAAATAAERALLNTLEGGCQVPIGTYARFDADEKLLLDAMVGSLDGEHIVRDAIRGESSMAESLGRTLAQRLLDAGAKAILEEIRPSAE